ncbi:MAG: RDD family protein [Pyrinomonadaceae bacterium]
MMYDTVREELQTKITSGPLPAARRKIDVAVERKPLPPTKVTPPAARKIQTGGLPVSKTSPTLVEFQNKNASMPDWRLQLQNAVQQRKGAQAITGESSGSGTQFSSLGATALKVEIAPRPEPEVVAEISDPRVANAMRRIDESRSTFLEREPIVKRPAAGRPASARPYRFDVVPTAAAASASQAATAPTKINDHPKPTLVTPAPVVAKRDTNKLPPVEKVESGPLLIEEPAIRTVETEAPKVEFQPIKRIHIRAEETEMEMIDADVVGPDDIEDLAPFSMRFSAGLFDLIIGAFATGVLLSPLAFTNGDWLTGAGLLTFAGSWAIVSFVYMSACLGFFGKTMGMRLFSLELVDAVDNEYPTLRQAAVNSAIFILSLPICGAGFITAFFNEERRALHDLLSGTILVREF